MRTLLPVVSTALLVGAMGCGSSSDRKSNAITASATDATAADRTSVDTVPTEGTGATVTNRQWSRVWNAHANGFGSDPVSLTGVVHRDTGKSLIVYGNPRGRKQPAEVSGHYPSVRERDYVLVRGTISGARRYDSVACDSVHVVTIDGVSVNPVGRDRASALATPATMGKRKLGLSQTRGGFRITLRSVAWTKDATRLEVTVTNRGSNAARISTSHAFIQQGLRQHHLSGTDKGAGALSNEIRSGATKSGTLIFNRISRDRGKAYIEFDWDSKNRDLNTDKPFGFTMRWKP